MSDRANSFRDRAGSFEQAFELAATTAAGRHIYRCTRACYLKSAGFIGSVAWTTGIFHLRKKHKGSTEAPNATASATLEVLTGNGDLATSPVNTWVPLTVSGTRKQRQFKPGDFLVVTFTTAPTGPQAGTVVGVEFTLL